MSAEEIKTAMPAKKYTLRQARCEFTQHLARLILRIQVFGRDCALDEVTERLTKKDPTSDHMKNSNHHVGLAADVLLYAKDGTYLKDTKDYQVFGEWWEKQHELARWGGRFGDGNHFSFEWQGRK